MFKPGDEVVMNDKYYVNPKFKGRVWTVRSDFYSLCGTNIVLLEGFAGGYAADGLDYAFAKEINNGKKES